MFRGFNERVSRLAGTRGAVLAFDCTCVTKNALLKSVRNRRLQHLTHLNHFFFRPSVDAVRQLFCKYCVVGDSDIYK
jgi:hypothetical protein